MKNIFILFIGLALVACSEDNFLQEETIGELSPGQTLDPANVEGVIISAYSILNGQIDEATNAFNSPASNWSFGDVLSDDAYKGGGGTGDQNQIHQMEIYNTDPTIIDVQRKWLALYEGVNRANQAIRLLNASEEFDADLKTQRLGEMRFLRGHFYFELKKIYNQIPYLDETAESLEDYNVSNTAFSSEQLWQKIEEDFQAAFAALPDEQADPGRATKWAAQAYLTKTYIFQEKWAEASAAADEVINSGQYSLMENFRDVFLPENDNGSEIIFAIQHSINDGSPRNFNGGIGDRLAPPGGPFYPQYGFHRPTQNLINAYKTNDDGLPVLNNIDVTEDDSVDPRLDHTTARPGVPYLDLDSLYRESWARDLATYGPYGPKKRVVSANSSSYLPVWPYVNALNYYVIRYADLLLWKAEAAIELGDLEVGRQYVNRVRERAMNSEYVMMLDGSTEAANYLVQPYASFANYDKAITALRTERRLELAHEGHRFFDLVRWGIAAKIINDYLEVERTRRTHLAGAQFEAGTHEYMPIPQAQIDLVGTDLIQQNAGY
ncbi:MAG: RagB/SusD family nutrient uptake outer membrane protein [Tunicatimonas sp.]|uniref:RagB/SusD family nutrient uptake outer membrane protein n=1 Tax=Tunicatimonas sp. TaxID=1940096 RepID=UPI003C77C2A4